MIFILVSKKQKIRLIALYFKKFFTNLINFYCRQSQAKFTKKL